MTEMDALRLRLAARAYRATRPDQDEVDRGVRRTLSAMRRSQIRRRTGLTPAIVVAILAFGTLAYASPNDVRRWVSRLFISAQENVSDQVSARVKALRQSRPPAPSAEAALSAPPPAAAPAQPSVAAPAASVAEPAAPVAAKPRAPAPPAPRKATKAGRVQRASWAEVNSALSDLSRHGDAATRAKAELGIAQLLWSRGDRASACSIARKLVRQGGSVQDRAQALLDQCKP